MPYAERGHVCVACVAIRAAVNGLNGQCVAIHMLGGDGSLVSEILKEFGVAKKVALHCPSAGATRLRLHPVPVLYSSPH